MNPDRRYSASAGSLSPLDVQCGGGQAAAAQPSGARTHEHTAESLPLQVGPHGDGVELADAVLDLEPARAGELPGGIAEQQQVLACEPVVGLACV
ncbi:hypothetical protein WDV91_16755 [Curtobacterium flaccumfaciens pv. flaccumfaciens]